MATAPLVSVLLSVSNGERFLRQALLSVLQQTARDLELLVVDDGSTDGTPEILDRIGDSRLRRLRNEERLGLAASLNRGLDEARGRFVARMDADDVSMPNRLERQLGRVRGVAGTTVLGSAVCDLDGGGSPGVVHAMPATPDGVRWHLLFGSPFFHPSVLVDREELDRRGLRYDPGFLESEDYDLWSRTLGEGEGANLPEPLVLYRVHEAQASRSRRDLQRVFQLEVARREIARVAPDLSDDDVELAWRIGAGEPLALEHVDEAASAYVELARRFQSRRAGPRNTLGPLLARPVVAAARRTRGARIRLLRQALALHPTLPVDALVARFGRLRAQSAAGRDARDWLTRLSEGGVDDDG